MSKTIKSLADAFATAVRKKTKQKALSVDPQIFNEPVDQSVVKGDAPQGSISFVSNDETREEDILPAALKLPLSQAIERMTTEVKGNYFKERRSLIIFLSDTNREGAPLKLVCKLHDGVIFFLHLNPVNLTYTTGAAGYLSN